ncbi:MAM and LDL-receptor class A domain-containing protein 1-like [Watersipora subatra]|uniref:MAM and LDL-receptor class A domain-containing protein 1-like n=1 Tax=Watersipora subatra TaxID=2589382 RepID=UPI00355C8F8B
MMIQKLTDLERATLLFFLFQSLVSATHRLIFDCTFDDGDWCAFNSVSNSSGWSLENGELVLSTSDGEATNLSNAFFTKSSFKNGKYCLKMEHRIADDVRLVVLAKERNGTKTVVQWDSDDEATSSSRWIKFSQLLVVDELKEFFLGFRGYEPANFVGRSIRLTRIHLYEGSCRATGLLEKCEFYSNLCQFTQQSDGSGMRWSSTTGIGSRNSGPTDDHTDNDNGYYASTDGSGYNKGDKSSLISPWYYVPSSLCVKLWYYMYGSGVGELNIYVTSENGETTKIWTRKGDQKDKWLRGAITYPVPEDTGQLYGYQVTIETVQGETEAANSGSISIDDYQVDHCNVASTIKTINCAFDSNFCLWTRSPSTKTPSFTWNRKNSNSDDTDSILGQESCAFVRHDNSESRTTELVSNAVFESFCMTFYYKLVVDSEDSELTIAVEDEKYGGRRIIWRVGGKQSTEWQKARVPVILETNSQYAIRIKASYSDEIRKSIIAVDDISAFEYTDKCLTIPDGATLKSLPSAEEAPADTKWTVIGIVFTLAALLLVAVVLIVKWKKPSCRCCGKRTHMNTNAGMKYELGANLDDSEYDSIDMYESEKYEPVAVKQKGEYYTESMKSRALPLLPGEEKTTNTYVMADEPSDYIEVIE